MSSDNGVSDHPLERIADIGTAIGRVSIVRATRMMVPHGYQVSFQATPNITDLEAAITRFVTPDGILDRTAPAAFLTGEERSAVWKDGKSRISLYKALPFRHVAGAIKSISLEPRPNPQAAPARVIISLSATAAPSGSSCSTGREWSRFRQASRLAAADSTAFDALIAERDSDPGAMLVDKGYDSDPIRHGLRDRGTTPEIPTKRTRNVQYSVSNGSTRYVHG